MEMACLICLTATTLPETLPFGQHPRCEACGEMLLRYLPCVTCGHTFHPRNEGCPTCGTRPPAAAATSTVWQIPDRLVWEALAGLQQRARVPAQAATTTKQL